MDNWHDVNSAIIANSSGIIKGAEAKKDTHSFIQHQATDGIYYSYALYQYKL